MSDSEQTSPLPDNSRVHDSAADGSATDEAAAASASGDRLIDIIQDINQVEVAASSLADRRAVVELLEVTTDEQRSSLLLALLLQRLRSGA
jgi:hypothetical protein